MGNSAAGQVKIINRERLGTITRSDGQKFDVYLLKVEDLRGTNFAAPDFHLELAAKALNITMEEFESWDFTDAMKALDLLGRGMNTLGKM